MFSFGQCVRPYAWNLITLSRHSRFMSSKMILDTSPPPYTRSLQDPLDRSVFKKAITVLAARTPPTKTTSVLKASQLRGAIIDIPKVKTVENDPSSPGDRLILLKAKDEGELSSEARDFIHAETKGLVPFTINLNYDWWSHDDILKALLPEELRTGAPSGFAATGHIAHVNLNDEYLPYKHLIGQLILDKNKNITTVVNKLNSIDHVYRFFKMELLAGEPNYVVEHHEADCRFTFDFTKVYWNSRLHTEHARLVDMFNPEDVIADGFAGVGPFAVPAAKKGCAVLANDLNPESAKYLQLNVQNNHVEKIVRVTCEDGRDFIKNAPKRCAEEPFLGYTPPISRTKEIRKKQQIAKGRGASPPPAPTGPPRRRISHFVMNLPDSAITFLDAFRGILAGDGLREIYDVMPMVHCHCFSREAELAKAEADIRQRVEEKLGAPLIGDFGLHLVRSVAPNKEMYCISFRLPPAVAFATE